MASKRLSFTDGVWCIGNSVAEKKKKKKKKKKPIAMDSLMMKQNRSLDQGYTMGFGRLEKGEVYKSKAKQKEKRLPKDKRDPLLVVGGRPNR